jgi:hypothetical protein
MKAVSVFPVSITTPMPRSSRTKQVPFTGLIKIIK